MAEDSIVDEDLGEATIVYEDPDDGTVTETVQNEHVAYFQDHWIIKTGEDDRGRDQIVRIPATRVYRVERTVQQFEEEIATLTDQVRSITTELRDKLPVGGQGGGGERRGEEATGDQQPVNIEVERGTGDGGDEPAATESEDGGD